MAKELWLIGSGIMSQEYAKVLNDLQVNYLVIGRGEKSAALFTEKTGKPVVAGGIEGFLSKGPDIPDHVIVSVGVDQLKAVTIRLLQYGIKNVLVEKPAGLNGQEVKELADMAKSSGAKIFVGYNRRFYSSTIKAQQIIKADNGVTSFHFEFTEWGHEIVGLNKPREVKENWFLANSSHVVDLAFFLGGDPEQLCAFTNGSLSWHTRAAIFAGAGRTKNGALFSYNANWDAPGRWGVEVMTRKHRLIFRPMEQLQIQNIGSILIEKVEIDDMLDEQYKPGLFKQTEAFLENDISEVPRLLDIHGQLRMTSYYNQMLDPRTAARL